MCDLLAALYHQLVRHRGEGLMITERRSRWCGIVALVALLGSNAVLAQATHSFQVIRLTTSYSGERGGSGGLAYNLSCPDGRVLVGVHARAGTVVDGVRGICRPVTAQGAWTGSESVTPTAGGGGGNAVTRRCPTNYAVSAFQGRQGAILDQIALECTRLASNRATSCCRSSIPGDSSITRNAVRSGGDPDDVNPSFSIHQWHGMQLVQGGEHA